MYITYYYAKPKIIKRINHHRLRPGLKAVELLVLSRAKVKIGPERNVYSIISHIYHIHELIFSSFRMHVRGFYTALVVRSLAQ